MLEGVNDVELGKVFNNGRLPYTKHMFSKLAYNWQGLSSLS
jgi:hypothetical protein